MRQPNVQWITPEKLSWERVTPTHRAGLNSPFTAYALSKAANVLHAVALAAELRDKGVAAFSLHPGVVRTAVGRNSAVLKAFLTLSRPFNKSPVRDFPLPSLLLVLPLSLWRRLKEAGASTSVFLAGAPGLEALTGGYFADCRPKAATPASSSPANAARLVSLSKEMLHFFKGGQGATRGKPVFE